MSLERQLSSGVPAFRSDSSNINSLAESVLPKESTSPTEAKHESTPLANSTLNAGPVSDLVAQMRAARKNAQVQASLDPSALDSGSVAPHKTQRTSEDFWGPVRLPDLYAIIGTIKPERMIAEATKRLKNHFGVTNLNYRERSDLTVCLQTALQCLITDDRAAQSHRSVMADEGVFRLLHPVIEGIFRWIDIRMPAYAQSPVPNLYLQHRINDPKPVWDSFRDKLFQARIDWNDGYVTTPATYLFAAPRLASATSAPTPFTPSSNSVSSAQTRDTNKISNTRESRPEHYSQSEQPSLTSESLINEGVISALTHRDIELLHTSQLKA